LCSSSLLVDSIARRFSPLYDEDEEVIYLTIGVVKGPWLSSDCSFWVVVLITSCAGGRFKGVKRGDDTELESDLMLELGRVHSGTGCSSLVADLEFYIKFILFYNRNFGDVFK